MPVVVLEAAAVGRTGYEPRDALDRDAALKARLEEIRLAAGRLMGLGDVTNKVVPKMALVAPPVAGGHLCTRSFIPHECHASIGVFAAVTVATACVLPGSPAARVAKVPPGREKTLSVEHPTGEFSVDDRGRRHDREARSSSAPASSAPRACFSKAMPTPARTWRSPAQSAATRPDVFRPIVS